MQQKWEVFFIAFAVPGKSLHNAQENNLHQEEVKLQIDLEDILNKEEAYWWQQSSIAWLKDGDINTSYFHRRAMARKQPNFIKGFFNSAGDYITDMQESISLYCWPLGMGSS